MKTGEMSDMDLYMLEVGLYSCKQLFICGARNQAAKEQNIVKFCGFFAVVEVFAQGQQERYSFNVFRANHQ